MQLSAYLEAVARDLDRATALADEQTRELTRRVASVIEPGLRLAMVQLLSDVAAQLTAELDGPVITIHMDGRDPSWHIVRDEATLVAHDAEPGDDDNSARVAVRLPEAVEKRAEAGRPECWPVPQHLDRPGTASRHHPRQHFPPFVPPHLRLGLRRTP